jgi:hypothetical protein
VCRWCFHHRVLPKTTFPSAEPHYPVSPEHSRRKPRRIWSGNAAPDEIGQLAAGVKLWKAPWPKKGICGAHRTQARDGRTDGNIQPTYFDQNIDGILARATARFETISQVSYDLDYFKRVNDTGGILRRRGACAIRPPGTAPGARSTAVPFRGEEFLC